MPGPRRLGKKHENKKQNEMTTRQAQAVVRESRRISTHRAQRSAQVNAVKEITIGLRVNAILTPFTSPPQLLVENVRKAIAERLGGTWPICNAISLNKLSIFDTVSSNVTLHDMSGRKSKSLPLYPPRPRDVEKFNSLDVSFPEPFVCNNSLPGATIIATFDNVPNWIIVSVDLLSDDI